MPGPFPQVVVFDLDGTLWRPEMYELWGGGAPFTAHNNGEYVTDRKGEKVKLLGTSRRVLEDLVAMPAFKQGEMTIAFASTCDEPEWARECLRKITLNGGRVPMGDVVATQEIYKARSKAVHLTAIAKKTGVELRDMIFFDNQMDNIRAVSPLGVTCVYCPEGITDDIWRQGLAQHAKAGGL